ncbi:MAG: hypothetical protein Kow0059_22340 [Candidatus Sumerlaeia bacterium]
MRLALAAAPVLLYAGQFRLFAGWAIDDPWISFQYARHLVEGKGLVFNPGERVEGYSNFLWVLQMAAAYRMGLDMLAAARGLGFLFGLLPVALLCAPALLSSRLGGFATPRRWRVETWLFLAGALLAASGTWAFWAAGGLETVQFATLAAACCALNHLVLVPALVSSKSSDRRRGSELAGLGLFRPAAWIASVLALLVALSRPEGAMFGACATLWAVWAWRRLRTTRDERPARLYLIALLWGFWLPLLAYTLWRRAYFGQWLPNTFYAKALAPLPDQLSAGFAYLRRYLILTGLPLFAGAALAALRHWKTLSPVLSFTALYLAFIAGVGGDWMPMGRFVVHILPLLAVLAAAGYMGVLIPPLAASPPRWPRAAGTAVLIVSLAVSAAFQYQETEPILYRVRRAAFWRPLQEAGEWLRANSPPNALVAGEEAGIIPFTSRRRFIDMLGIVDPHVARRRGALHEKFDAAYVLGRRPDFILLHVTKNGGQGVYASSRDMLARPEFQAAYEPVHRITIGQPRYADRPEHYNDLVIYRRKPLKD